MKKWFVGVAALCGLVLSASESFGFGWCCSSYCAPACAPCVTYKHVQVERKVLVPVWTTEKRQTTVCEYRTEPRTQVVTRHRCVPVVKDVPYEYYVSVPETRVDKQTYHVCVPYTEKVKSVYTVMVPKTVVQEGVRRLCRMVPHVEKAYRTVDQGCWEDQVCHYTVCCGGCFCAPCYQTVCSTHKVWRSNCVQVAYDVTVHRPEYYDEKYTYNVTVCEPVQQESWSDVCRYRTEARVRDVTYTVCRSEKRVGTRKVTEYATEAYQENVTYHVCVPVHTVREYDVRVCSYAEQCVTETVCVPCYDYGCGHGHAMPHAHH